MTAVLALRLAVALAGPGVVAAAAAQDDAIEHLKAGVEALDKGRLDAAQTHIAAAAPKLPLLADYTGFWLATIELQRHHEAGVARLLEPVWRMQPATPLAGRAALMEARAAIELKAWKAALEALARVSADALPQPQATLAMARALEGAGNRAAAALQHQTAYYFYPLSDEAKEAKTVLARLEHELGEEYPAVKPQWRLDRAQVLMDRGQPAKAREEYEEMQPRLSGVQREQARVRAAACLYQQRKSEAAASALAAMKPESPEAEAERLHWLVAAYQRLEREGSMMAAMNELSREAPASPWRQRALILAANSYLVQNDFEHYVPLFSAAADSFSAHPEAPQWHWKVVWRAYLERRADAETLLRAHLERFPGSEKGAAALYYLARVREGKADPAAARVLYDELQIRFPNHYYAILARERARRADVERAGASAATTAWLEGLRWSERVRTADFTVDAATARHIERARLLASAGLDRWAEGELRFGARNGGRAFPLAVELAETAQRRGAPEVGMRYIKSLLPGYLGLARDGASRRFWKLAFPFPYRADIEKFSRQRSLDPFLVAALIRQESEFDAKVVSYANAIGLMQVLPVTGRDLGKRIGLKNVRAASLKVPSVNLNIGTYYLRLQLDARDGNVEETLAGYNAGPSRIPIWRGWGEYRETSEFVETIPFMQTREYVQILLRNADIYRWLYSGEPVEPAVAAKPEGKSATKPEAKAATKPAKPVKAKGKKSAKSR